MLFFFIFCYGAIWASFCTCYAYRFANQESILTTRSHCESCQHPLKFWQLIPLLGYLLQRGRCAFCSQKISPLSSLVELFFALYLILILATKPYYLWGPIITFCAWSLFLSLNDYLTQSVPSIWLYLGGGLLLFQKNTFFYNFSPLSLLFLILLAITTYLKLLGSGDLIYLIVILLSFGFYFLVITCLLASCLALIVFYFKKNTNSRLAFIPFLSIASFLILFCH